MDDLNLEKLMRLLAKARPEVYGGVLAELPRVHASAQAKKPIPYDIPDLSVLPPGQRRAVQALVGGGEARKPPDSRE